MFPDSYSQQQVIDAINQAYNDPTPWQAINNGRKLKTVEISSGIKIRVLLDPDGKIITVFPIH